MPGLVDRVILPRELRCAGDSSTTDLPDDRIGFDKGVGPADRRFRVKSYPLDLAINSPEGGITDSIVKCVQTRPDVSREPDQNEGVINEELKTR